MFAIVIQKARREKDNKPLSFYVPCQSIKKLFYLNKISNFNVLSSFIYIRYFNNQFHIEIQNKPIDGSTLKLTKGSYNLRTKIVPDHYITKLKSEFIKKNKFCEIKKHFRY
ncbi:hypothetical protein BpHYR1_035808 [Brachionus plicatilis]|uniref:Uncharacterized protein n=1 Tax=Brachionus plicatilis TaxID=10195 RepID=A0A3M7P496_BRAPC|nr:hypothetical protein BpHYR1_035808 [Brachionus plicatilis]